jgi:hydroxypyruvate reductase
MAHAAAAVLEQRLTCGVVTALDGSWQLPSVVETIPGAHPLPDRYSVLVATRALEVAAMIRERRGLLLAMLSGGGSAMMALPVDGVTLADKRRTIDALSRAGLPIAAINCVRKHLSAVKGGRLAAAVDGDLLTLAISDVHEPPDDPSTIASGPTAPDPSTFRDAVQAIDAAGPPVPAAVRTLLERGAAEQIPDTPTAADTCFRAARFRVIANRHTAMHGAGRFATERGYAICMIDEAVTGEAADAGKAFVETALAGLTSNGPGCAIASGETTVTIRGPGRGGRNQEFVLGAARELARRQIPAVVCSVGTDGVDGPTNAAGAVVSSDTTREARARGLDLDRALGQNDAYAALDALGALVKWGPTDTNVGDVHVLLTR